MRIRRLAQPISDRGPLPPCPQCGGPREEVVGISRSAWLLRLLGGLVVLAGLGGGTYSLIRGSYFAAWLVVFLIGAALVVMASIAVRGSCGRYWNCPSCGAAQEIPPRVGGPDDAGGTRRKSSRRRQAVDPDEMDRL